MEIIKRINLVRSSYNITHNLIQLSKQGAKCDEVLLQQKQLNSISITIFLEKVLVTSLAVSSAITSTQHLKV